MANLQWATGCPLDTALHGKISLRQPVPPTGPQAPISKGCCILRSGESWHPFLAFLLRRNILRRIALFRLHLVLSSFLPRILVVICLTPCNRGSFVFG